MTYKNWTLEQAYFGWQATHPDYDASYEGEEDGCVSNGKSVWSMTEQGCKDEVDAWIIENLPEGLREHEGKIEFQCRSCESWTEWPADVADFDLDAHENVCGGSPWCLP